MSKFNIQNLEDETVIENIAMNIDNENNIWVKEDGKKASYKIID